MNRLLPVYGISRLRFGTDGPGIRTLIGTYGCPLRCKYCINPESWDKKTKIKYLNEQELFDIVKKDSLYFRASNGGLTFGGGEPVLHAEFIESFVKHYCANWNIDIETSLNVPTEKVQLLCDVVDRFIIDIKDINNEIYSAYTGAENTLAVDNLKYMVGHVDQEKIIVRVPLIPNYNDAKMRSNTIEILKQIGVSNINCFTYTIKEIK